MSEDLVYRVVAAKTEQARKQHRLLVEEALHKRGLSPELREQLEEQLAQLEAEEARKEKERQRGGKSSSSGGGGSAIGHSTDAQAQAEAATTSEGAEEFLDFQLMALLLLASDRGTEVAQPAATDSFDHEKQFISAATFLFDREEGAAHIHEPFLAAHADAAHAAHYLPALEHHAVGIGAKIIYLRATADAVDLLKKKYGYQPLGQFFIQGGMRLQRMTKALGHPAQFDKNTIR